MPTFLQKNEGDPAIKVGSSDFLDLYLLMFLLQNFLPKLREHLLPQIQMAHCQEAKSYCGHPSAEAPSNSGTPPSAYGNACNFVFFKKDCVYQHKLSRFHFTTYDVRRGTDIINPRTSRRDVMLLAHNEGRSADSSSSHHFLYVRVLGAYHANVIYTGLGMRDYEARRLDFLWV